LGVSRNVRQRSRVQLALRCSDITISSNIDSAWRFFDGKSFAVAL
jgi:hypothetical protein